MGKNKARQTPVPPLNKSLTLIRIAFDVEQEALAEILGVSRSLISNLEGGRPDRTQLTRERLEQILGELGIPSSKIEEALALQRLEPGPAARAGDEDPWGRLEGFLIDEARSFARRLRTEVETTLELREAQDTLARLRLVPRPQRRAMVETSPEFRGWALVKLLCTDSRQAASDDPAIALELAELALAAAELVPDTTALSWRCQGYALAHVANAQRVGGRLPLADESMAEARELWKKGGTADPAGRLDVNQILSLEVSLRWDQRRAAEAAELVEQALASAEGSLVGDLLVQKAGAQEALGDFAGAIRTLERAERVAGRAHEAGYRWLLRFTKLVNLCHLGRAREAARGLPEVQDLATALNRELDHLRLAWLEARVAAGLGRRAEAAALFAKVHQAFAQRKIAYDAALVALERSVVLLEEGHTAEVQKLSAGLVWVFQDQGVPGEALKALALFREAVEKEIASAELARQIVAFLYRAQNVSDIYFEVGR